MTVRGPALVPVSHGPCKAYRGSQGCSLSAGHDGKHVLSGERSPVGPAVLATLLGKDLEVPS